MPAIGNSDELATFVLEGGAWYELQHPYLHCLGRLNPVPSVGRAGRRYECQHLGCVRIVVVMVYCFWLPFMGERVGDECMAKAAAIKSAAASHLALHRRVVRVN